MTKTGSQTATTKRAKPQPCKLAKAINRVATAIRRDVRRHTNPTADFDYSTVLSQLDAARKFMDGAADPPEVKRAVKGLIAAARMLGRAL